MEASRADDAYRAGAKEGAARTLAQTGALVIGATLIGAGILGFFFGDDNFSTGAGVQGKEFLGFEVNGWHNVVHIATGALLVLMAPKAKSAVTGLLIFAAAYAVVTVLGFIDGDTVVNFIPVNFADNVLHAVLTVAALLAALAAGGLGASARTNASGGSAGARRA